MNKEENMQVKLSINQDQTATLEVDIILQDGGKKTVEMILKQKEELVNCTLGKAIILNLKGGTSVCGFFKGMDGSDDIMIASFAMNNTLGCRAMEKRLDATNQP